MNPLARAIMGRAGAGGAPWTPASLANRMLHLDASSGVVHSGSVLTAWADQSPATETITITGSPTYNASDANMSSQPTVSWAAASEIIAPNIVRANIRFIAAAARVAGTSDTYIWDGDDSGSSRIYMILSLGPRTIDGALAGPAFSGAGKRFCIVPLDGSTASRFNGTSYSAAVAPTTSGNGMNIASNFVPGQGSTIGEIVMCSSVPPSGDLDSLYTYWTTKYGAP